MTELYEFPPTRSQRAKWVLEELGINYTSHLVDLQEEQQQSETYRAIHPLGVVPALKTDNYTIFESVAIVLQLIDETPEANLAPAIGTPERANYYQWCIFACAEMDPPTIAYFENTMRFAEEDRDQKLVDRARHDFSVRAEALSKVLADQDYMLGAAFSGADILIGHSCFMAEFTGLIVDYPVLQSYYSRLQQRPAYQRAYDVEGQPAAEAPAAKKVKSWLKEEDA